ncbi:hypothetical protein FA15DRAFT_667298 [Coprinopsis marcescibilis]|uniref:GPI transamidase component PIG-S n=1 Tax=Coprinopsis marcescibilis TaxID=230819 RepID=A0A5C3L1K0_COPMA|nr:hypothetical protein FA15DRAFT_667298 [Coprinopsis marcescibilis]
MNPPAVPETGNLPASLRDPSTLFFQYDSVRRSIIAAYWVAILLATPLWWYTTSIERLPLPISQASQEISRPLQLPVNVCLQESKPIFAPLLQVSLDRFTSSRILEGVQIHITGSAKCETTSSGNSYIVKPGQTKLISGRALEFPMRDARSVEDLTSTLVNLIVPHLAHNDKSNRAVQFASRYRLAFSLLNEDASSGSGVMGWNVEHALTRYITPILDRVSHLHNFTIESQVQFHAPLAFDVQRLGNGEHSLSYEDLTVFVNSAEWTLSSSFSNEPVIHLVAFVPSSDHSPLRILEADGTISNSNAFILPQWGGIVLYNPSEGETSKQLSSRGFQDVFGSFANQLLSLLGVPNLPAEIQRDPRDRNTISDWQLDALLRRRTLEAVAGTKETLGSFIKLVDQIDNMPIGPSVRDDVQVALSSLNKVYDLASTSLFQTFTSSASAFDSSSRAFFNPGMLALLYFPAEHKYAVYTPLFATSMIPLAIAALREFKIWKQQRKQTNNG